MHPESDFGRRLLEAGLREIQERAKVTDIIEPDDCCSRRLSKALFSGHQGDSWDCPKCGCEWRGERTEGKAGTIRRWTARPVFAVLR